MEVNMTNFQVYKKTLSFSLLMFVVGLIVMVIIALTCTAGFFIGQNIDADIGAIIGLIIGLIIGIIAASLINIFINNRIKAAQTAIMVKGVTEDNLPDHAFKEGFNEIKGRFGRITGFYFITRAIKGIFRQLGRGLNRVGRAVGGQTGDSITSAIDSAIQILVGYLCDCCLGWIIFRKDQNVARAGCEGAVIFFKHGKTLIRNVGRIFGMGFLSLLVIGGGIFGLSYLIFNQFPGMFETLSQTLINAGSEAEFINDPQLLMIYVCALIGIILWSILHSVLIRPFILVGVMRNYMAAGQKDMPKESDFAELANKSPRFAKLSESI